MSHFVPDFDTDDDYVNVSCSKIPRKPIIGEEEGEEEDLMELLWHNGQVVLQNQRLNNNNNVKKQPSSSSAVKGGGEAAPPQPLQPLQPLDHNLFIQEDEMTSWLQYPDLRDDDFCSDLLFPAAPTSNDQVTAARPPVPPSVRPPVRNFMNFSRLRGDFTGRGECGPSESGRKGKAAVATVSQNPGASSSSAVASKSEIPETGKTIVDDRKRKETEATDDETECRNEPKQGRGSTSTKRSRAAQVHNLSERKRRDRINERMKALQELIPRCNKSDKASMLDEAIEYMKSLQLQIQMMSMGCGMMPMMYTGMQQYMPHMAMGMGMGMEMGVSRPPPPFMPFPNMLASQRPLPALTRIGGYPVHASDPSRVYVSNQQFDPNSSQAQYSGYMDPYQQFRSLHPSQPPQFQNQETSYPSSSKVSSSKESEDQGNQTTS